MLDYVDAALFSKSNKFQGFVILSKYPVHTCGVISITDDRTSVRPFDAMNEGERPSGLAKTDPRSELDSE